MRELLSPDGAAVVAELARPGTLVVLDFDGTLAPIVRDRRDARLPPRTARLLARVASRRPTAVLSGRAREDVAARLEGAPVRWIVGGHGAEWPGARPSRAVLRAVAGWRRRLAEGLRTVTGIDVEDKAVSLSVHWRASRDPSAGAAVMRAARALRGARLVGGKRVVNVVPEGAPDKGDALARLVEESGCARVLFVGDDLTDEAGFRARLPVPAVMVRVGRANASDARWFVRRRADVDRLLERLAARAGAPASTRASDRGRAVSTRPAIRGELGSALDFMRTLWALEQGLERRSKEMHRRFGVTGPQRLAVRVVGRLGPISPGRLAKVLHLHPASVTRLARALERRGVLLRRPDPEDRRRLLLALGPAAARVDRLDEGTVEGAVREALASATSAEREGARRLIERIAERLLRG